MLRHKATKAFTLVELSIVIVIIGLIVAGVTAGKSLVKQAKLRSVIADVNRYKTSINAFLLQYNALPGDIRNASSYWSGAVDGNGDKRIDAADDAEYTHIWNHLSRANIVSESYVGGNVGGLRNVPGANVPRAPLSGGYTIAYTASFYGQNANMLYWASDKSFPGDLNTQIISGAEAKNIDTKMDDGIPNYGKVLTAHGAGTTYTNCVSSQYNLAVTGPATYNLTIDAPWCRMFFVF